MRKINESILSAYNRLNKIVYTTILVGTMASCGSPELAHFKEVDSKNINESTKGVITTIDEVKPGEYLIADEKLIDKKNDSYVIVNKLDGTKDSTTLQKLKDPNHSHSFFRMYAISRILNSSLAGNFFSRDVASVNMDRQSYKNQDAFTKSSRLQNTVRSTGRVRSVSVPTTSSKGYGSSRSFRSLGG